MEELLFRYNPWWEGEYVLEGIIEREEMLLLMQKHFTGRGVVFLTGLRRVGKTTLLRLLIRSLISGGQVDAKHVLYISLDDYLLARHSILDIVEEYRKIQKIRFRDRILLFLDEITYKKDFEVQLKNLYDLQNVKIYASSSSSSLMKKGKPYLTGRSTIIEVLPLDFDEFMRFKNITLSKADSHLLERYFEEFMWTGGIPEFVLRGDVEYLKERYFEEFMWTGGIPEFVLRGDVEYLKELVDDIIYKDIAVVYGIKNPDILKEYFLLLMERAGKPASINKIARILKVSPDTAKRYFEMFVSTCLIYPVARQGKTNERLLSPKKVYAADLGIRTLFTGFRDKGSLFENYVYLKIKHRDPRYVYEGATELDFITNDGHLIEVKYNSVMTRKQQMLFDRMKAEKKTVIRNIFDLQQSLAEIRNSAR